MAIANSQSQIGFVQLENTYGTIPNTTGTPTVANADAFRIVKLTTRPTVATELRPAKTVSLSALAGIPGACGGDWSATVELAGSGTAGTASDIDPFLENLFGGPATVSAGVSLTHHLHDACGGLSIWNYRDPAAVQQQCAFGAIVNTLRLTATRNSAVMDLGGPCRYVLTSKEMATLTDGDLRKGGLTGTSWAARPSSPTYLGSPALGLYGSCTIDGQAYTSVRELSLNVDMGRELDRTVLFGGICAGSPLLGVRNVTVSFTLEDSDVAALATLKGKALAKTVFHMSFVIGSTAGNIWTWNLNDILLDAPDYDDSQKSWGVKFSGRAHASSDSALDELQLVLT